MNEGDRIKHRKDGTGTVLKVYPRRDTARCLMDSGKTTTYSRSRLAPAPRASTNETARVPTGPTRTAGRSRTGTGTVDYGLLERARVQISKDHPGADHVVPRLYSGRAYCEVWVSGRATTVFFDDEDGRG